MVEWRRNSTRDQLKYLLGQKENLVPLGVWLTQHGEEVLALIEAAEAELAWLEGECLCVLHDAVDALIASPVARP